MKRKFGITFIVVAVVLLTTAISSIAQDVPRWTRWRGANNDGISKETGLNLDWTVKKPPLAWTFRQAGSGYASPVIVGKILYCQGGAEGIDFAFALDTQTGNLKWKQDLGEEFAESRGNGARGSITVDGDKLYMIRGGGQIHCLSAADGKIVWQKDFKKDFNGKMMSNWGYSESPLIEGNLVICTPGGADGTMIAFNKNTGATEWRCKEWTDDAGYSSPIAADIDGVRQIIQQSGKGFAGVSAKDGKLLWRVEVPGYRIAIIPTPVFNNGYVYITAGYNAGCNYVKPVKAGDSFKVETVYSNKNLINQHGGVVLINGHIYGFSDPPIGSLVCQNVNTGENVWTQKVDNEVVKGTVLAINDRLLVQNERNGFITLVAASPDGYKDFGKMEFPERTKIQTQDNMVWTHPVVADGKLYLRDHDLLFCYDLKK